MGVRGPAPGKFVENTPFTTLENGIFGKDQGIVTCLKSPFYEITIKFLADHAARQSLRSRIHESKISKSRDHALRLAK